jgi:hypothetical protein
MQQFEYIEFTENSARLPQFDRFVPHQPYFTTPMVREAVEEAQTRQGRRVIRERHPLDAVRHQTLRHRTVSGADDLGDRAIGYFHDGRLGDDLVHTAVYRQLRINWPGIDLHEYRPTQALYLLHANRDIGNGGRFFDIALSAAEVGALDGWLLPSPVGYENRAVNDDNIYTLLERDLQLTIEHKRPYVYLTAAARDGMIAALAPMIGRTDIWKRLVVCQLESAEECRTPYGWYDRLWALRRRLPEYYIMCFGSDASAIRIEEEAVSDDGTERGPIPGILWMIRNPSGYNLSPNGLLAVIERAALVVSPDSFFMHAAAALDVPCIALWQTQNVAEDRIPSPESRVSTYPNVAVMSMHAEAEAIAERAAELVQW